MNYSAHMKGQAGEADLQLMLDAATAAGYFARIGNFRELRVVMVDHPSGGWTQYNPLDDDRQTNELAAMVGISTMHMLANGTCIADVDERQWGHRAILEYEGVTAPAVAATMRRAVVTVAAMIVRSGRHDVTNT